MSTTAIYRTQVSPVLAVSTVLVREGGERFYETTIVVSGTPIEGRRNGKKSDAGYEHDAAVDFARGKRDEHSVRCAFWTRAFAAA